MTEDEAKTKWCPFVRVSIGLDPEFTVHNRVADAYTGEDSRDPDHGINHPAAYNCIGSQCMAWRWSDHKGNPCKANEYDGHGYCGLAGAP